LPSLRMGNVCAQRPMDAAKNLLKAAREALAAAKEAGDPTAKLTGKIGVYSAYRTIPEDSASWEGSFAQYYEEKRVKRAAFPSGEHGRQALTLMTNMMISYKLQRQPTYASSSRQRPAAARTLRMYRAR
jgi:hypothetical protein